VVACADGRSFQVTWANTKGDGAPATISTSGDVRPCKEPPPQAGGFGRTWGEPHILTLDGAEYDFQAVGEFVLSRGADGFEVRVRQVRLKGLDVAVNPAVALRAGDHRIAIYAHAFDGVATNVSRVYVDGAPVRIDEDGQSFGSAIMRARGDSAYDI